MLIFFQNALKFENKPFRAAYLCSVGHREPLFWGEQRELLVDLHFTEHKQNIAICSVIFVTSARSTARAMKLNCTLPLHVTLSLMQNVGHRSVQDSRGNGSPYSKQHIHASLLPTLWDANKGWLLLCTLLCPGWFPHQAKHGKFGLSFSAWGFSLIVPRFYWLSQSNFIKTTCHILTWQLELSMQRRHWNPRSCSQGHNSSWHHTGQGTSHRHTERPLQEKEGQKSERCHQWVMTVPCHYKVLEISFLSKVCFVCPSVLGGICEVGVAQFEHPHQRWLITWL